MTNKSILTIVIWIVLIYLTGCAPSTPDEKNTAPKPIKIDPTQAIQPITTIYRYNTRVSVFEYRGHRYIVVDDGGVIHTEDCRERDIKTRDHEN